MSRTWLLRGAAVAVFAMLLGAWALGAADVGGDSSSKSPEKATPASPEEPAEVDIQRAALPKGKARKPRRTPTAESSPEAVTEPSPTPSDEARGEVGGKSAVAPTKSPRPKSSQKPPKPQKPRTSNPPSNPPSSPPTTQPGAECTELSAALDCILAPITSRP